MEKVQNNRVQVHVRIRPSVHDQSGITAIEKEKTLVISNNGKDIGFTFDGIFGDKTSQDQIFTNLSNVLENVVEGYNGTIMAYGQTGAGKTHTMTGKTDNFNDRGICPRAIEYIFKTVQKNPEYSSLVRISYIEIYNEQVYDLLASNDNSQKELIVQENKQGETVIRGCSLPAVTTEEAALSLLFEGETNRTIAEHCQNATSTRSHCIFTIYIEKRQTEGDAVIRSKLNIVDLAGSERMKKTKSTGNTMKEALYINKSLTFLEQVVIALSDKKREHIPYRQTTLTNILKDSLGGNCKTSLIACIWSDVTQTDQTLATLKFATRMMRVKTVPIINLIDDTTQAKIYKNEIQLLKQEIAFYDSIRGIGYTPTTLTPEQKTQIHERINLFIQDPTQEIEVIENPYNASQRLVVTSCYCFYVNKLTSVRQIKYTFSLFRDLVLSNRQGVSSKLITSTTSDQNTVTSHPNTTFPTVFFNSTFPVTSPTTLNTISPTLVTSTTTTTTNNDSNTTRTSVVSPTLIPTPISPRIQEANSNDDGFNKIYPISMTDSNKFLVANNEEKKMSNLSSKVVAMFENDQEALCIYRKEKGAPTNDLYLATKGNLKKAKQRAKKIAGELNAIKSEIDSLKQHDQEPSNEDILAKLKLAKKEYRLKFEEHNEIQTEVKYLQHMKSQHFRTLVIGFEQWRKEAIHEQATPATMNLPPQVEM